MADKAPVLTVDGPAAVGKGTVARAVAEELGFNHLDSGRIYRAVGALALRAKADLGDAASVMDAARETIEAPGGIEALLPTPWLDGEEAGAAASKVATLPEVREALLGVQRAFLRPPGLVADGRDMGTIIFPDAGFKVFLEASYETRLARLHQRMEELAVDDSTMRGYLERFSERDARDRERDIAPVRPADDATVIHTDDMDAAETTAKVIVLYRQSQGSPG